MMRMIVDIRAPRLADPSPACPGTSPGRRVEPSNPVEPKARRFRRGSRYSTCSCSGGHVRAPLATGVRYRLNTSRRTRTFLSTRQPQPQPVLFTTYLCTTTLRPDGTSTL